MSILLFSIFFSFSFFRIQSEIVIKTLSHPHPQSQLHYYSNRPGLKPCISTDPEYQLECELERQGERQVQVQSCRLTGPCDTESARQEGILSECQSEREQRQSDHQQQSGLLSLQRQSKPSTEHGQIERQPEKRAEPRSERQSHSESAVTPEVQSERTRRVSPSILEKMRQFENNDDVNAFSSGSSQESDKEFYSQYVQGTEPRKFVGLPNESKDSNGDKMSVGEDTAIGSNADVNVSDSQNMSNKETTSS